jgi:hypothetical protein
MTRENATHQRSGAAVGWTVFAAFMMIMLGSFHMIAGLAGLVGDNLYVTSPNYVFQFDTTTWGWIHLIGGAVAFFAGLALFQGAVWARTVGVIIALGSAVGAFAWLPIYPIWGFALIAIDVAVIWALTAHGRDITLA